MTRDAFYVGYLPLPKTLRGFVFGVVGLLLLVSAATAAVVVSQQNDPGDGTWDLTDKQVVTGWLAMEPYPHVELPDGRWTLLVGMGKAAAEVPGELVGKSVQAAGYPIGGERALLLAIESPGDIRLGNSAAKLRLPAVRPDRELVLQGQIIDPKCYFGAMKPGEGKVHKACATLCLAGGIPPFFMTTEANGERSYYLLMASDQSRSWVGIRSDDLRALLPYVGEAVQIKGMAGKQGDLNLLVLGPKDLRSIERR